MGDDLGQEAMALVADGLGHAAAIRPQAADQKLPSHHLTKDFAPVQAAVREWRREIVTYFDHPYTTGYVEGVNNMLSKMQRMGTGYAFE
jgi:transposase